LTEQHHFAGAYRLKNALVIILVLWLPLFSGNAVSVSLSMTPLCQASSAHKGVQSMAHQVHKYGSCADCGFCRIAGNGFMASSDMSPAWPANSRFVPYFYLLSFSSITSAPLDPPPLALL
jgi:hypothetical protein